MTVEHPILSENESKRLNFRLPMLICYSMFLVWQMGIVLFSGDSLSVVGKTPIPFEIDSDIVTMIIAFGYILSIAFLIFFGRFCVKAARITIGAALISALALYLPFPSQTLSYLFYFQVFCCVFMIGVAIAIIVNLFTETTELKDVIVTLILGGCLIAVLQNDMIPVSFSAFQMFTLIALAALLFFFIRTPAKIWPSYVKKSDGIVKPKAFMTGIYALIGFSSAMTLFGSAVAGNTSHGVFAYYLSYAVCGVIFVVLWKKFRVLPLKSASAIISIGAFGFVLAIASLYIPALALPACALLGAGGAVCCLSSYFGVVMAKRYPSRFITPVIIGIGFVTALLQSALLEALRENLTVLYTVYLAAAVGMVILYLLLEPYFGYSFRSRSLKDIIGVVAEEESGDEIAPAVELAAPKPPAEPEKATENSEGLHAQRMDMLVGHAIQPLTPQEYNVADLIMRGLARSEIAQTLGIKPESVSKYRGRIYSKFGIHKRQDLFKLAESLDREWADED
jgi:DNA-binding CsgD family transcriptional regulator